MIERFIGTAEEQKNEILIKSSKLLSEIFVY